MFAQAGLTIFDIRARRLEQEGFQGFREIFQPVAEKLSLNPDTFFVQTEAFQYIVRALKGPEPTPRMLIHSLLGETKVCARVRIIEPNRSLATIPGVRVLSEVNTAHDRVRPTENKVFIWQRILVDNVAKQQELLRRGYLIVAEYDDDPLLWPEHQANDFLTFRSCHGVQVSTEPLAEFLRHYNPNVAVFPNQLAYLPPPRSYNDAGPVNIFFGALNREPDWSPIMPELNKVLWRYKHQIRVTVIHDRRFFDAVNITAKEFIPFCSYKDYEETLRSADIAILPLEPTRFNAMKSDLKFLECAGHGVAVLASPTVYAQSVIEDETGLIYRTPQEFAEKLDGLIADTGFRRRLCRNAYDWVTQDRLLNRHYRERYQWYLSLLERLPELSHSLAERVPEIRR